MKGDPAVQRGFAEILWTDTRRNTTEMVTSLAGGKLPAPKTKPVEMCLLQFAYKDSTQQLKTFPNLRCWEQL